MLYAVLTNLSLSHISSGVIYYLDKEDSNEPRLASLRHGTHQLLEILNVRNDQYSRNDNPNIFMKRRRANFLSAQYNNGVQGRTADKWRDKGNRASKEQQL